jgi:hypothetical protein
MSEQYEHYLELIEKDAATGGLNDFRLAREEFHKLTGEFEEGEPWFEIRMTMFLDWYLLDRTGPDGFTPNQRYLATHRDALDATAIRQFESFSVSLRSVFQIRKITGNTLLLEDLVGGGEWKTRWTLPSVGLGLDRILNTRIVLCDEELLVGRGTVLHPVEAHESVVRIINRGITERMPNERIVNYMDKVKLKLDRYSNVKIKHVYQYPTEAVF